MGIEEIKAEVAAMPHKQQDHLAAYLVHLRHQRDAVVRREITAGNDDRDPTKWVSLDQLKEEWKG